MVTFVTATTVGLANPATAGGPLTLVAILTLLALLIQKELAGTSSSRWARRYARLLNVPIVPLLIVFAVTVGVRVAEALQ